MKANLFQRFRRSLLALVWVATLMLGQSARAQNTTSADEQAIRNLVAQQNNGQRIPFTSKAIFWSGAYPRPVKVGQPETEDEKLINERMRKRSNQKSSFNIERLVIAQSGDIAYEYGRGRSVLMMLRISTSVTKPDTCGPGVKKTANGKQTYCLFDRWIQV